MQRKNNIVLRLHRQRKPEQVLLPLVREDNGEALRVILEKQDNVTFCRNSTVTERNLSIEQKKRSDPAG